jgi:amino acid adenylation domain-containing protein
MLVSEFLEASAAKFPQKVALIDGGRRLTYLEIEEQSNRLANALIGLGLGKQDRAAVFLEPSAEAVISIFGILKAGGVFLVVNPQVKPKKLAFILNDCRARVLITDQKHSEELGGIRKECPSLASVVVTEPAVVRPKARRKPGGWASYSQVVRQHDASRPVQRGIDIDLASLIYTSGTTGNPKGVMLTHLNMVSAANSITEYLANTPDDIILNVLPLSFDYGLYQILMAFKVGGTVIQERSFLYPYRIIDLLLKEKVTGFPIVPTIAAILLRLRGLQKHDFPHLRYITNTAQALPPKLIFQLQKVFPGARIFSMYGLTECKRVSYLPPEELSRRPASVGKAIPNTEVYLVDEKGMKIEEPDRAGQLVVRGANVMKGYWNLPEDTERVLKPGPIPGEKVLYTGDLFRMDAAGFLYFIGRKDDIIKVAGERVSPKEVENELHEIDGVSEAAIVGVPDEILGQALKAFVVLKPVSRLTEKDIIRQAAGRLESFKVPKFVEFRKELPRSAHGKVTKRELG